MKIFLIFVNDENFYRLLPEELGGSKPGDQRVKVMGFPPLGIETLAPVLRQHGHQVRMFDTCHPQMKEPDIAQALRDDPPDVVALSFLSTTTYPAAKSMARSLKSEQPAVPIIVGGVFATMNADRVLEDCPSMDCLGVGEGEELLPDYLDHLEDPAGVAGLVWRDGEESSATSPGRSFRIWTSSRIPTGPRSRLITSNPCLSMCRPFFRWRSSARCRPRGVVPTAASIATSRR